ncbi:hypothetical protein [Helicobacter apodemus]|uniref:Uncharacterized protein n=1 Tax=Helicobacter apodemus TaxID=135569 RepID=A0A2U8FH68_9HELI|nr:hypothetical protein [Helicobacter apodemus]AWI34905.1 hypothetical protein CDV25_09125 [Helicobacter apodemus]
MPESNQDELIEIFKNALVDILESKEHLTPTLNDIYDMFAKIRIKFPRNDKRSATITKHLKEHANKQIILDDLILHILQDFKNDILSCKKR